MNAESTPLSADRIRGLMASPHDVVPGDLPGLRVWRDRFPYASSLSVLVALAAAKAGAVDQQSELLRAASGLASRDALFNLFVRPRLIEEALNFAREVEDDQPLLVIVERDHEIQCFRWHHRSNRQSRHRTDCVL